MKKGLLVIFCFTFFVFQKSIATPSPRITYNFNSDWKLYVGDISGAEKPDFNDANWKPVTLPEERYPD